MQPLRVIRSHYRICMEMSQEWEEAQERKKNQDQVFNPLPLKHLCRRGLKLARVPISALVVPNELLEYLEKFEVGILDYFSEAPRCTGRGSDLRVGHFSEFKGILEKPNDYCFSTKIHEQAKAVLRYYL